MTDASLRFTRLQVINGIEIPANQYLCGGNTRMENGSGRPAYIHNRDLGYTFEVEHEKQIYTAFRVNEHGSPVWMKPRKLQPMKPSGKTVEYHMETTDTRERKELFGYAARRVITRMRQTRDSQPMSESECDGWYIDPPAAWARLHPPLKPGSFCYITTNTTEKDDHKFSETGERENGFALFTKRTSRFTDQTGKLAAHESVHVDEITEISEAPLARDLFLPPPDFKRVLELSNVGRRRLHYPIRLQWELLKDAFRLPGKIAAFIA